MIFLFSLRKKLVFSFDDIIVSKLVCMVLHAKGIPSLYVCFKIFVSQSFHVSV